MSLMWITELDLWEVMIPSDLKICASLIPLNETHTPEFPEPFFINHVKM